MNDVDNALKAIIKTVRRTCLFHIEKATFDKTYQGRISKVISSTQYEVSIYGNNYTTYSSCGLTFKQNDSVWLTAPQNDFDSIYISGKRQ